MAIAQHYGLATSLLDWTENPLVFWFALEGSYLKYKNSNLKNRVILRFRPQEFYIVTE